MNWSAWAQGVRRRQARQASRVAKRERQRLARDLHDGLSQDLYAAQLSLSALLHELPARYQPPVEGLITRHTAMITSLRSLIEERAAPTGTMATSAVVKTLDDVVQATLDRPIVAVVHADAPRRLERDMVRHARMALREMVSNAVRHSAAEHIDVSAHVTSTRLVLGVDDDGIGFDHSALRGRGLVNLSARARWCGGTFSITPRQPHGTTSRWSVPVEHPACQRSRGPQ